MGICNETIVSMQQPTFMPWVGYFELVAKADVFVILSDAQFSYQSYDQRNRIFLSQGRPGWATVSVDKRSSFLKSYDEVIVQYSTNWNQKLWRSIEQNYCKTPYFSVVGPQLQKRLFAFSKSLADLNVALIMDVLQYLRVNTTILFSKDIAAKGKRSAWVAEILRATNAKVYLSARGSFDYMKAEGVFPLNDVATVFQNHRPQPYAQRGSQTFVPYLSIYDALFNVGPDRTRDLVLGGTQKWDTWDDMNREGALLD